MNKLLPLAFATMLASPALAGECDAPFPLSLFEEKANGENCEPNQAEKVAGDLIVLTIVAGTILEVGGVEVWPLGGPDTLLGGL